MSFVLRKVKDKNTFECKISDVARKKYHESVWFGLDNHLCCFYVKKKLLKDESELYWVFYLLTHRNSIYPLYYTLSVDKNGQHVLARKGIVVEQARSEDILLGELSELFVFEHNSAINQIDTFTVLITLIPNWKEGKLPADEPTKLETLSNNFAAFYKSKTVTDCVLRVGKAQFPVHRSVLSARSTVFSAMFHHDTTESRHGEVNIPDVEASALDDVLYYMYSGKIQGLTADTATSIFMIADKYALLELRTECLEFLKSNLTMGNFCEAVSLSYAHGESDLEEQVVQFFVENFEEILKSNTWQQLSKNGTSYTDQLYTSAFRAVKRKRLRSINLN